MSEKDDFIFLVEEEDNQADETTTCFRGPWKLLIVDDDEGIIQTSIRVLRDFTFEGRKLKIISATSGKEAKQLITAHRDTAVMLLDVIMETDDAGFQVVSHIRKELDNQQVRILLRTGQAGQFDEDEVFEKYDINDFLEKSDLTSRRLKTALKVAFRSFRLQGEIFDAMVKEALLREVADSANRVKSNFLENMSHELRSPMTSIKSGLGIIASVISDPEADEEDWNDVRTAVQLAQGSAERLLGLLNGILDLSKLEAGKMEFNFQFDDLEKVIQMAIQEVWLQLQEKQLTLKTEMEGVDTHIIFDFDKMMQVAINLLSNAIKFTPEGKEIMIIVLASAPRLELPDSDGITFPALTLIIKDQGVGIPEDELDLVFDKFTQSSSTKTGAGGTGLGLPITAEIILAHNGSIRAENNPEGGASFIVTLPRKP